MSRKIDPGSKERIIRNYGGGDLSVQRLLDVLEGPVAPGASRGMNELVRMMSQARKHRNRAAHTEGSKDKTMHYTVFIDGRGHHLRLDQRGVVFHVTDHEQGTVGGADPWVPPGAAK